MKRTIICLVLLTTLLLPFLSVSAQEEPIEIKILQNSGLTQFSNTNYTLDCEKASSNIITVQIESTFGNTYVILSHIIEHVWVDSGFRQLDRVGNLYSFQFTDSGLYRIKVIRETVNATSYRNFFINVIGGNGTYATGDIELLMEKGRWVDRMMLVFDQSWDNFQQWSFNAFRFYSNPIYVITDFIIAIPMFLLMPQVWFIIAVTISLIILMYRHRIRVTQRERQLTKKHGVREDLIRDKRKAEEEKRLYSLTRMPIDHALSKYGDGDWLPRSVCYHEGAPRIGVSYPTAYSLALELGANLFSDRAKFKARAEEILEELVDQHENILEKSWIYKDISACCRAVSAETVDIRAQPIIKDKLMRIADLADEAAKRETVELFKKLHVKAKDEKPLSEIITDAEKQKKKTEEKSDKKP